MNRIARLILAFLLFMPSVHAAEYKEREAGFYRDVFDQNIYYEATNVLHLERPYRSLFRKPAASANVNIFDEVPDSSFFTNRHGRTRLLTEELKKGPRVNDGPDLSGPLSVIKGKFEGMHPGFFVRDASGDEYLLKFDPVNYLELNTSAEVIASHFYHAIGYNVPQYTIAKISASQLAPDASATMVDDSGFNKPLTAERLAEYLLFLPQDGEGNYRASASKVLPGKKLGPFSFNGRRKDDPEDTFLHKDRRELRSLVVFSAWLGNYDIRESNTLDMLQTTEDGREVIKHYLIDFNTALGAGTSEGSKPPMVTHEYLLDYGEGTKAFLSLGWWEKIWQRRWREAGDPSKLPPAVGYFDNRYFEANKFKSQLPHFAFKDVTRADGFWAAKIISRFTDEEIQALVKTGGLTREEDVDYIARTLSERRDLIARYWFSKAAPLDDFEISGNNLTFRDLAVERGFENAQESTYEAAVFEKKGKKKGKKLNVSTTHATSASLENASSSVVMIRVLRPNASRSPWVLIEIEGGKIQGIRRQD